MIDVAAYALLIQYRATYQEPPWPSRADPQQVPASHSLRAISRLALGLLSQELLQALQKL
jgi:hypothetical protein